jgi:hypothetical protein
MIDWFIEQTWLIEALITIIAGAIVAIIVYFWVEHFGVK